MNGFGMRFEMFLDKQRELHKDDFNISNRGFAAGHNFPLMVSFQNNDRSYMMNIKGAPSVANVCGEYCFYEPCEVLTEQKLEEYFVLAAAMRDELAQPDIEGHQYTMVGLVICTDELDSALEKKIKKFSQVKRYKEPQTGWSEIRLCVVNLNKKEIIANKDGKALKNRIENGIEKAQKGWFYKFLGLGQ